MSRIFSILFVAAILYPAALSESAAAAKRSHSGYGSGPYYFGEFRSKKPVHGYSGWHPGPQRLYCDYDRIPVRKCNSKGRCRVVEWIIKPYCY